ncbi:hypothetical protein ACFWXB_13850 [Tsukamurella tyrosinosolvens]|uniref:hypothetical protein n=1 Tax=Tsukamurella tyrosinosolvens TaxID=57704 RepID=UPI002DD43F5C|nr:hypothetical protein [Tsukamurella tyrosinosolvens]MEC4612886.1 hypothetical protein [Tsukamurella tyrosinosolvens]
MQAWWAFNTSMVSQHPSVGLTVAAVLAGLGIWVHGRGKDVGKKELREELSKQDAES